MHQSPTRRRAETVLPNWVPPSSPPTLALLIKRIIMQTIATELKSATLNPSDPAGT